jgi:CheY-like chemotaxis protein
MVEPFVAAGEPRKDPDLGLALVYGIVQQHKGRMSVTQGSEGGAAFRICLPLAQPAEDASQALSLPPIRGGDESILVAEDDEVVRTLLAQALTEFGYRVVLAVDGEDAVRKYMEHRDEIALMVLDVLMPRKNGREVYDKIRIFNAGAKAIFMSGYTGELLQEQGIMSGGQAFLPKPVQITDLLRKIRDVLDAGPSAAGS